MANSRSRNVVIVTDGQSFALDPQKIARSGLRVNAVLIGEDALEGAVAALAGMTGGQVFVAAGSDAASALTAACQAARMPHRPPQAIDAAPTRIEVFRRGARILATWGARSENEPGAVLPPLEPWQRVGATIQDVGPTDARLIGATAAMLAIPLMPEPAAAALAEREGIACHLTSLVLVDEFGECHTALPALRSAASPATAPHADPPDHFANPATRRRVNLPSLINLLLGTGAGADPDGKAPRRDDRDDEQTVTSPPLVVDLALVIGRIDWEQNPEALRLGDIDNLPHDVVSLIRRAARVPTIAGLARTWGIDVIVAIIGLLAEAEAPQHHCAERLARAILADAVASEVAIAMREVGL